ncbi:hypothetical protein LY90DRAFT_502619 [Neocallimastix californiae]|uniref:Uncharacterized protein n=1 Tax=Neocallimastix californiae TaxID=1754190 RepID=A0A1Y2ESE0_9FUNG|nr:hypothetical protein LY90DRAFT_502619 [Neocallimastix californiae]|eukprot:ORY74469.1 hypothetical protein LY90DRAFT_502619 [Neocallimastix californiae]
MKTTTVSTSTIIPRKRTFDSFSNTSYGYVVPTSLVSMFERMEKDFEKENENSKQNPKNDKIKKLKQLDKNEPYMILNKSMPFHSPLVGLEMNPFIFNKKYIKHFRTSYEDSKIHCINSYDNRYIIIDFSNINDIMNLVQTIACEFNKHWSWEIKTMNKSYFIEKVYSFLNKQNEIAKLIINKNKSDNNTNLISDNAKNNIANIESGINSKLNNNTKTTDGYTIATSDDDNNKQENNENSDTKNNQMNKYDTKEKNKKMDVINNNNNKEKEKEKEIKNDNDTKEKDNKNNKNNDENKNNKENSINKKDEEKKDNNKDKENNIRKNNKHILEFHETSVNNMINTSPTKLKLKKLGLVILRHSLTPQNYDDYINRPKTTNKTNNEYKAAIAQRLKSPSEIFWTYQQIERGRLPAESCPYTIKKVFLSENKYEGLSPLDIELRYMSWSGEIIHILPDKPIEELFFNAKCLWVTIPWENHLF